MRPSARTRVRALGTAAGLCAAAVFALLWIRRPSASPELRGYRLAGRLGCFGCHGPGGTGGVPNPGSEEGEIPAWTGGTMMMYVRSDDEIAEWIRFGAPTRLHRAPVPSGTPPIRMPGFAGRVSDGEVSDLVAYLRAVGGRAVPPAGPARDGYRVAARFGCFGCHGPAGRTGSPNPGSFKGVIPGWTGPDFRDLVRNDEELQAWIQDGGIPRLDRNPPARRFTQRQMIRMPSYRKWITAIERQSLVSYIRWLNAR